MAKVYDKKPALAVGILGGEDDDKEDDDGYDTGRDAAGSIKKEACAQLASVLGVPPEKHADLEDALSAFLDAHSMAGESEPEEPTEDEEPEPEAA